MDPTTHATPTPDTAAQLAAREAQLTQREEAAETLLLHAATRAVEQAVAAGQILPAHRDFHLTTIQSHKDGIEAARPDRRPLSRRCRSRRATSRPRTSSRCTPRSPITPKRAGSRSATRRWSSAP